MVTTAADASGNGNTGTYLGSPTLGVPGLITGDADTAVDFTSATPMVINGDAPFQVGGTDYPNFALGVVLRPVVAADPTFPIVLSFVDEPDHFCVFDIIIDSSGIINAFMSGGAGIASCTSLAPMTDGGIYFVAVTCDGTDVTFYVNGVLNDTQPFTGFTFFTSGPTLYVGNEHDQDEGFTGTIDEAWVLMGTQITSGQITTINDAVNGTGSVSSAIIAVSPTIYWRLGDAGGGPINTSETFTEAVGITDVVSVSSPGTGVFTAVNAVGVTDAFTAHASTRFLYKTTKPDTCTDPSFSPDGNNVIFVEKVSSTYKISRVSSSGGGHTVLQSGALPYSDPIYSPDGDFIAFAVRTSATGTYGEWALQYMSADGTGLTTVLDDGNANLHPTWATPTQLTFQTFRYGTDSTFQISVIDLAGNGRIDIGTGEYPRVVAV